MCPKLNLFAVAFAVFGAALCQESEQPCHYHLSVNITGAEVFSDRSVQYGGVLLGPDQHFLYSDNYTEEHRRGCLCLEKPCFRKCCPDGYGFWMKDCVRTGAPSLNPFSPPVYDGAELLPDVVASEHFALLTGDPCTGGRYMADPQNGKEDLFYLQQDGQLYMPFAPNETQLTYCIDMFLDTDPAEGTGNGSIAALICFAPQKADIAHRITRSVYSVGMFISIPFLVATFAVYAFVPELRNLHGKSLMCYISGLIVGYTVLAPLQFTSVSGSISIQTCVAFAFIGYFFLLVTFFWLNVMCFDIWWTFSGLRGFSGSSRRASERKRFVLYSLYGWGVPLLIVILAAVLQFYPVPDYIISPDFGVAKCWFKEWRSEMLFLYTPMICVVFCNFCLFTITACKIVEIKKETSMLQNSESGRHAEYEKDKQRFKLYLKLFIVMGVNWMAELISFLVGGDGYWWILTDLFNTVLGVYIFIIFVWKRKVKKLIVKRYHLIRYGKEYTKTPTSSQSGHTTMSHTDGERSSAVSGNLKLRELKTNKV